MKKLFSISALAAAAALAFAGPATAADMPVKAAPPPPPAIYDWSGLYVGFHEGYLWGTVQDSVTGGFVQTDSDVKNWIAGFHAGYQKEFAGLFGFGGLVLGVEGGLNAPLNRNDLSNFTPCANPAFSCGITNFHDNWYAGGRLGLAFNLGTGGWLFGGDYLLTVSGGWTTAVFQRADVLLATGAVNAGGGQSLARHDGGYVGAGIDHVLAKGVLVDWVSGIDWQHQFFDAQGDLNANGVIHNLSADVDIIRLRTTLKFK
jgi:outer membrane immunogenic protein